jgi:hypothetical protein
MSKKILVGWSFIWWFDLIMFPPFYIIHGHIQGREREILFLRKLLKGCWQLTKSRTKQLSYAVACDTLFSLWKKVRPVVPPCHK